MIFKISFVLLISISASLSVSGQQNVPTFPLKIVVADESILLPGFRFVDYRYEPAFLVGTEYPLSVNPRSGFHLLGTLGWYFHRHFRTSGFANIQLTYRLRVKRFHGSIGVGPGASLAFATQPVYAYNGETYVTGKNSGQLLFMPAAALELGYQLSTRPSAPELLFDYSFALEDPFALVPAPHLFVGIGVRFYPFAKGLRNP